MPSFTQGGCFKHSIMYFCELPIDFIAKSGEFAAFCTKTGAFVQNVLCGLYKDFSFGQIINKLIRIVLRFFFVRFCTFVHFLRLFPFYPKTLRKFFHKEKKIPALLNKMEQQTTIAVYKGCRRETKNIFGKG